MLSQWEQVSIPRGSKRVAGFTVLGCCLYDFIRTFRRKSLHIALFRGIVIGPIYGTLPACLSLVALRWLFEIQRANSLGAGLRKFGRLLVRRTAQAWVVLEIFFYCYFRFQKRQLSRRRHLPASIGCYGGQRRHLMQRSFEALEMVVDPSHAETPHGPTGLKKAGRSLAGSRGSSSKEKLLSSSTNIVDMATSSHDLRSERVTRSRGGGYSLQRFNKSADRLLNKSIPGVVSMECLFRNDEVSSLLERKQEDAFLALKQAEIRSWFFEAPLEKICHENLEDWVLEYFFNGNDKKTLSKQDLEDLAWSVDYIVKWLGLPLKPGRSKDVYCMRLSRDELPAVHRPLWIYGATSLLVPSLVDLLLGWQGFTKYRAGSLQYWHRPKQNQKTQEVLLRGLMQGSFAKGATVKQSSGASGKVRATVKGSEVTVIVETGAFSVEGGPVTLNGEEVGTPSKVVELSVSSPLVFCHGLGIGILPYLQFISELARTGSEMFLIILPYIAMNMKDDVQSGSEVAVCALDMLSAWNHTKAHFVGHSFGTVFCAWVLKQKPQLVLSVSFVDPVCFLMMKSDLLTNALYKDHTRFIQYTMQVCVFQELFICHSLMRNLFWWDCNVDASELVAPCFVLLAGSDDIVPAHSVRRYLEAESSRREAALSGATRVQQSGVATPQSQNPGLARIPLEIMWKDSWIHFKFCTSDANRREVVDAILCLARRAEDMPPSVEEW